MEAKIYASENTLTAMCNLAKFISTKYDGIIWNEDTKEFGKPNPNTLNKLGSSAFSNFEKELNRTGFNWKRAT